MEINNSSNALNDNSLKSPEPIENTINHQSAGNLSSPSQSHLTNSVKPGYLNFLRIFSALSLIVGILASLAFIVNVLEEMRKSYGSASYAWLISLSLAIESFLAYGLLNAIADIAENMIEVGNYVRDLKRQNKS